MHNLWVLGAIAKMSSGDEYPFDIREHLSCIAFTRLIFGQFVDSVSDTALDVQVAAAEVCTVAGYIPASIPSKSLSPEKLIWLATMRLPELRTRPDEVNPSAAA